MGRGPGTSSHQDISDWYLANLPDLPGPPEMTPKEIEMAKMGVVDYIEARKAGQISTSHRGERERTTEGSERAASRQT